MGNSQNYPDVQMYQDSIDRNVWAAGWIDLEQDFLLDFLPGVNQDRNYTQGTAFSYQSTALRKSLLFVPLELLQKLQEKLSGNKVSIRLPSTLALGITAFTPRVIDSNAPINGDRPFANLVWVSTQSNLFNSHSGWFTQTGLNFGLIGSNTANVFQSFAHRSIVPGRPTAISWHHQISHGGSPAFLFSMRSMKSLVQLSKDTTSAYRWLDISAGAQLQAGWYTGAGLPVQIRIGRISINSIWSTDLVSPLSNGNRLLRKAAQKDSLPVKMQNAWIEQKSNELYAFVNALPRITLHNSLILGQPGKKDIYVLDPSNYNPLVLDLEYGLVYSRLTIREQTLIPVKRFDLILSMLSRSSEITGNKYRRWHHWGRISLRFPLFN